MKKLIREAKKMCLDKYGVNIQITFNAQGFDLGIDEPIYYVAQSRMIKDIKKIIGAFRNTDVYVI